MYVCSEQTCVLAVAAQRHCQDAYRLPNVVLSQVEDFRYRFQTMIAGSPPDNDCHTKSLVVAILCMMTRVLSSFLKSFQATVEISLMTFS